MKNRIRNFLIAFFISLSLLNVTFGQNTQTGQKKIFKYTNPITRDTAISMRDHFIIKVDKNGIV